MADVRLSPQTMVPGGITPTNTGGLLIENTYLVKNDGKTFLHFKKSGADDCVVTIQTPISVGGLAVAEQAVTIPATVGDKMLGPFPEAIYNDGNGDLKFTVSEVTGLTVAVVKV